MKPPLLVVTGLACLAAAQGTAWAAWHLRPAAQAGGSLGALFRELPPGEFVATLALGGLRGLAVDSIWLRASQAKESGRFYESVALFQLIGSLQPRFELVWEYMAHDMAYNIQHEVGDPAGKWSWFVAGVEANRRGCLRNPHSHRLLRHLAWMFFHRGERHAAEIMAGDWKEFLRPLLEPHGLMPAETRGLSPWRIAHLLYLATVKVARLQNQQPPGFVERLIPLTLDREGVQLRNKGEHRRALAVWLEALEAWQQVPRDTGDVTQDTVARDSYQRNEGRLRRRAAELARRLSPDPVRGTALAEALEGRRWQEVRQALSTLPERSLAPLGVKWLDGQP